MNRTRRPSTFLSALWLAVTLACAGGCHPVENVMPIDTPPTADQWKTFAARRIVFGHQSVGRNILDGVTTLAAGAGIDLPITETRDGAPAPGIAHFGVGANGDPLGKIRDFAAVMDGPAAAGADIALMKLCYIDFSDSADPAAVAAAYGDTLAHLQQRHPATVFVAVTTPLTTVQSGPKALVKKMLGRAPAGQVENTRREAFNAVLRARFGAEGRLFDLAALESGGGASLNPALTYDGGHLNETGARLVAERFVAFLAGLPMGNSGTKAP
jgi:hypothetical protein